jgi:hypothetical protein
MLEAEDRELDTRAKQQVLDQLKKQTNEWYRQIWV